MTPLPPTQAVALARAVQAREIRPTEIVEAVFARIGDDPLGAWVHLQPEVAFRRAEQLQARLDAGEAPGPLAGVPVALKDNLCEAGAPCTAGSRVLAGYRAPYSATVVERLESAGAIVVGRTNMDEFAMGSSTEFSAWKPCRNPWDPTRVPGGSSGGSAVAVATGAVPLALGSDTGGSVRQPAAFCGVLGLKPTWGRLSRYGLVAFASSLDHVGLLATSAADLGRALGVMAGADPHDATSAEEPAQDWESACNADLRLRRVGLVRFPHLDGMGRAAEAAAEEAARVLAAAGAKVEEVEVPAWEPSLACYYVLAPAEASSNLARYDGIRYGARPPAEDLADLYRAARSAFGPEVKRRILLGTFCLSAGFHDAYYARAQAVRAHVRAATLDVLQRFDLLLHPTTPTPAFRLGERLSDPVAMYLSDLLTVPANLAGIPALSVPAGRDEAGLPLGVQVAGRPWDEALLLSAAGALERARNA